MIMFLGRLALKHAARTCERGKGHRPHVTIKIACRPPFFIAQVLQVSLDMIMRTRINGHLYDMDV